MCLFPWDETDALVLCVYQKGHLHLIKEQLCGHQCMCRQEVQEYSLTFPNEFAPTPVTHFTCLLCPNIQAGRLEKSGAHKLSGRDVSAHFPTHPVSGKCCERCLFARASHLPCEGKPAQELA